MSVSNREVSKILSEIGEHLDMQGAAFKPRAYEKAAQTISGLEEEVGDIYMQGGLKALEKIPGVGASIAEKIEELLKTGRVKYYGQLKKKTPVDLASFSGIQGLGPKSIKKLYQELGVKNLSDLEKAARAGQIGKLEGFGKKSEGNILKGIEFAKKSGGRFVLGFVMPEVRSIEARLKGLAEVDKIAVAGSARRMKETIGDIDILAISKKPSQVIEYFVSMPEVVRVYAQGPTRSSVKIKSGIDVDIRVVPEASYGAALNYFTGSKDHNVALRTIAVKKGWKLSEYGLFREERGNSPPPRLRRAGRKEERIAGRTEEDLYKAFGMDYVEPEMRENTGELELALRHKLPKLVGYDELMGDLQTQTDWTDGSDSIETMARAAAKRGLIYIAITDHTKRLAMTHGLDEKRIQKQWLEIDRVNNKLKASSVRCQVLKGTECDILKDGTLDLPDEILSKLDVVGASVHSHFNLSRADQTERVKRAIENPYVDILFHPTGRIIQRRDPYDLDIDEIIKTAKATGAILEIDAYPDRLDLKDEHIRKCVEAGVKMSIDSDAHNQSHFAVLEYGIAQARRGWAKRGDIINAWPLEKMLKTLKGK